MTASFGVLIVEDDPLTARLLSQCVSRNPSLSLAGNAMTAWQAVTAARRVRPDLVLLDFGLPESETAGFDVWRALHELDAVPDVIAVTGAREMSTVVKARQFGAFDYVVKPFDPRTVDVKLAGYAGERRRRLAAGKRIDQPTIDNYLTHLRRSGAPPKGLDARTMDCVVGVLQHAGRPLRTHEVAGLAGIDRGTANRYLLALCDRGIVVRFAQHGVPGHPAYLYTLAAPWRTGRPQT